MRSPQDPAQEALNQQAPNRSAAMVAPREAPIIGTNVVKRTLAPAGIGCSGPSALAMLPCPLCAPCHVTQSTRLPAGNRAFLTPQ